jgi:predicted site-specific integrase-resolvase
MIKNVNMKHTYSPKEFGLLIGRTTKTLQRWDREGILKACRSITKRRYYTHDHYLEVVGQKSSMGKRITYCRVSSAGQKAVSRRRDDKRFVIDYPLFFQPFVWIEEI